jgi:adenylate cyclase
LAAFVIHLFAYVAVCGFVVAAWALTAGSFEQVGRIARDPSLASTLDFWPIWVILGWGVALVIHLGVVLSAIPRHLTGERARKRRRKAAKAAARAGSDIVEHSVAAVRGLAEKRRRGRPAGAAGSPARRWVTVMFTDIADSTTLNEKVGDEEWSRLLARYRELVRAALVARGGKEVGTQGDGFLARFPDPAEAVRCSVDVQRRIREAYERAHLDLRVRIGIHAGEVVEDDGDVVGQVVNLAARVTGAASPSEILVTEPVADYLGGRLQLEDRGLRALRGVSQPRHLLAVCWDRADRSAEWNSQ